MPPARLAAQPASNGTATPLSDVVLVSMPFGPVFWPSLGLSLLASELGLRRVATRIRYFTLPFASLIGDTAYSLLAMNGELSSVELAGEWVFSGALFGGSEADAERYVREILVRREGSLLERPPLPARAIRSILRARGLADAFLDRCVRDVVAHRPKLVGFTSVFQQHVASLALAKRLRAALPDSTIVFGGANCEGVMGAETMRRFPFVDAVVSGEADEVFPELVRRALAGEALDGLTGVRTPARLDVDFAAGRFESTPPVRNLDALPLPDYSEYFEEFTRSRFANDWQPGVFVETSRGCWWGERNHCTFCGLNGQTMSYRSKSPERALKEFEWLGATYPDCDIQVVDNILDLGYFKTLLPQLAERGLDFGLFYETKSNLKREQVKLLGRAGVRHIQPGIESLSDDVLARMHKGVTALQNIQLLKWCKQYGVTPMWNLLWGFPGEPAQEYANMARLIPWLTHLRAPSGLNGLRLDRFSPSFDHAERMGFTNLAPLPAYAHVYPLPEEALRNLAYSFRYEYRVAQEPARYLGPMLAAAKRWRRVQARSDLFFADTGTHLVIWDLRPARRRPLTILAGAERNLYLACDAVTDVRKLFAAAAEAGSPLPSEDDVRRLLAPRVEDGLVLSDGGRYLALAVPLSEYRPSPAIVSRFRAELKRLGRRTSAGYVVDPKVTVRQTRSTGLRFTPARACATQKLERTWSLDPGRFRVAEDGTLVVR